MSEAGARSADDATPDDPPATPPAPSPDESRHEVSAVPGSTRAPVSAAPDDAPAPPAEDPEDAPVRDERDDAEERDDAPDGPEPSWWQSSHPTFAGLVGFFAGVAYVIIVPGVYAALLGVLVSDATAQKLFPLVLVALLVPIVLLVWRKTRRFAQFMLLGIVSTAVVIAVTAALVLWVMVSIDG